MRARAEFTALLIVPERLRSWAEAEAPVACPPSSDPELLKSWVALQVSRFEPTLLVVDVFPRGVLKDLPPPRGEARLLVTRCVRPGFYLVPEVAEALDGYDDILWTEPPHPAIARGTHQEPILFVDAPLAREPARAALKAGRRPLVLGLGSGPVPQQQRLRQRLLAITRELGADLLFCSPLLDSGMFATGRYLRGADLVVTAAGYQSYYEVVQAGVPAVFLPQRRQVDDQARRARGELGITPDAPCAVAYNPDELAESIARLLPASPGQGRPLQGAEQAAAYILGFKESFRSPG